MEHFDRGTYFGNDRQVIDLDKIILTETKCKNTPVDWHYHENPYLSLSLEGHCLEKNKKKSYSVKPGTLIFHNWQDAHCNTNHSEFSRNFYVELESNWFIEKDIQDDILEGSTEIDNPFLKSLFNQLFLETKLKDEQFQISTESLLLNIFSQLERIHTIETTVKPQWVKKVKEVIHDKFTERITLQYLSKEANIHPTHLSRDFSRYFNSTIGNYIRKVKVEHSAMLLITNLSLTEIAYQCGFADQSHFIRCFRSTYSMTPTIFRKILASR